MTTPMPDAGVRTARAGDGPELGRVHAATWRTDYAQLLPRTTPAQAAAVDEAALTASWAAAVSDPPTPQHRVLVATAGAAVVGFAALGPSPDADAQPDADAELVILLVDPAAQRSGHGSRLLNASADVLRDNGFRSLRVWVPEADTARTGFLTAAGLLADGATRLLDAAGDGTTTVREVRLSAALVLP